MRTARALPLEVSGMMRTAHTLPLEVSGMISRAWYTKVVDVATCGFIGEYNPKHAVYFEGLE